MKQRGILWDDSYRFPHTFQGDLIDWLAINEDSARAGNVEPIEKSEDGGLSTPGGTDDGHFLPSGDDKGEVFENGTIRVISEVDLVEGDGTSPQNQVPGSWFVLEQALMMF